MQLNNNLVGATGKEIFGFGGETAWRVVIYRGYIASLEWLVGARSTEPILCIQDAKRGHDAGVFGICLSSIGKYADQSGYASPGALVACWQALPILGKAPLEIEARKVLDVILHFASDLIKMPVAPMAVRKTELGKAMLEVELTDENTGKVQEEVSI